MGSFATSQITPDHRGRFVEAAPMNAVMFDQLEYLLAHKSRGCPAGCADCIRLKEIEGWLLQPFRAPDIRQPSRQAPAAKRGPLQRQAPPQIRSVRDYLRGR
jgi:hypothetical protein